MGGHVKFRGSQLDYTTNNETWIVDKGGMIFAAEGFDGVYSSYSGSRLINKGTIVTVGDTGVQFDGTDGRVINNAGAVITALYGVYTNSTGLVVNNFGAINGQNTAIWADSSADDVVINNFGKLYSPNYVVYAYGGAVTIHNSGLIKSTEAGAHAIDIQGGVGRTLIDNKANGVIQGGYTVWAVATAVTIHNAGKMLGITALDSDLAGDIVRNTGIMARLEFYGGPDKYNGVGGKAGHVLGMDGADRLIGGSLRDWFDGGLDRDVMTGNGNADRFVYQSTLDSPVGATHDVITDFRHAQHDRIDLANVAAGTLVFRGSLALAGGGTPSLRYTVLNPPGTANDKAIVYVDYDGNGTADAEIELKGVYKLVAGDFIL